MKPRFPRQVLVYVLTGTVAAVGVLSWLVTTASFWTKVEIIGIAAAAILVAATIPYLVRSAQYMRLALSTLSGLPEQLRSVRTETWLAVETNALFGATDIVIQRLREDGSHVLFLLNIGAVQGVRPEMMFELVAVPDMEVYGVVRAEDVSEEMTWCRLVANEGQPEFSRQMRVRLAAGEVAPPPGYEARPFMADSYQHVWKSLSAAVDPTRFQSAQPAEEEDDERQAE